MYSIQNKLETEHMQYRVQQRAARLPRENFQSPSFICQKSLSPEQDNLDPSSPAQHHLLKLRDRRGSETGLGWRGGAEQTKK